MPAKLIICCPGRPNVNGPKRRTFLWNPALNCYVHENRVLTEREYMACYEKVFKVNADLRPQVKIIEFSESTEAKPSEQPAPPVATISAAREIGLDEALEVIQRLAPEKLRKTNYGRKPDAPAAAAVG